MELRSLNNQAFSVEIEAFTLVLGNSYDIDDMLQVFGLSSGANLVVSHLTFNGDNSSVVPVSVSVAVSTTLCEIYLYAVSSVYSWCKYNHS